MRLLEFLSISDKNVSAMIYSLALGALQYGGGTPEFITQVRNEILSGQTLMIDDIADLVQRINHEDDEYSAICDDAKRGIQE